MDSVGPSVAAESKRPQDRRKRRELEVATLGLCFTSETTIT